MADVEGLGVTQVVSVTGCLVHPSGRPQQLVIDGAGVVQWDGRAVQLHRGRNTDWHHIAALQLLCVLLFTWQHHCILAVSAGQYNSSLRAPWPFHLLRLTCRQCVFLKKAIIHIYMSLHGLLEPHWYSMHVKEQSVTQHLPCQCCRSLSFLPLPTPLVLIKEHGGGRALAQRLQRRIVQLRSRRHEALVVAIVGFAPDHGG